jgi:hypothetical protein
MALLPLLRWGCCRPQAGIITLVAMALLSSWMLLPLSLAVKLASLPSMRRCLLHCSNGDCCSRHNGIVAVVNAQACLCHCDLVALALLSLSADFFALMLYECRHHHCTGIVSPVKLACLCHCAGVAALVTLVLLPLLCWH